ncbi:MAG: prevent-host-death protein [Oscillospiraceae bacterium]|jgi:antitoxin (DNA-binding transcriptional repressor) of toxin-antitoxin stability system|nr:prevent-host-death protein [Oscillospiraceae bacterium]
MKFVTAGDLRASAQDIWGELDIEDEIIVTDNGKPTALVVGITENNFEETLRLIRQARLMREISTMREEASERGYLSDEEIDAEIQAYRKEKRSVLE